LQCQSNQYIPVANYPTISSIKMAAPRRKITQHEWDLHADTINDLYHARGLPLHTEKGGQSVLQIMQDDHQFFAR
jgi:hypothetical protein